MDSFEFDLFVDATGNPETRNRVFIQMISETQKDVSWLVWRGLRSAGVGMDRKTIGVDDGCLNCHSRSIDSGEGLGYCVKHGSSKRGIRPAGACPDWRIQS